MILGELTRYALGPNETLGALQIEGLVLQTLEDPWRDNAPMVSCIPPGEYLVVPRRYFRGGYDAWEVTGVPGRTHILIHKRNTAEDVTGCILVGSRVGILAGNVAVLDSASAFGRLRSVVGGVEWTLTIRHLGGSR